MKYLITSLILLAWCITGKAVEHQRPTAYVDERIELTQIVCRLADISFYQNSDLKSYAQDVDRYFAPYKDHELMLFTRQLWGNMSLDAMAKFAVTLDIKDGKISFIDSAILDLGSRWLDNKPQIFVEKLNDFYTTSNFHQFFVDHAPLYRQIEERYNNGALNIDFAWFDHYFGQKSNSKDFKIVLNLLENSWNYGPKVELSNGGKETAYSIVCAYNVDDSGLPTYDNWSHNVVIHELALSYANTLIDKHTPLIDNINKVFYKYSADLLRQYNVYNDKHFLYETIVRACEIQYHKSHSDSSLWRKRLNAEMVSGFLWLETLCDLLTNEYESNRDKYPTMDSFMPLIAQVFNNLSPDTLSKKLFSKAVKITNSSIPNGAKNIDTGISKLIISFDRAMFTGKDSYGIWPGKFGDKSLPIIRKTVWSQDGKQLILSIRLESDREYSLKLPQYFFISADYEPIEAFHLEFKTSR